MSSSKTKVVPPVTPTTAPQKFITIDQAAEWLCTPVDTIRAWILQRKITAYRPGMRVLLDLAELEAMVLATARPAINAGDMTPEGISAMKRRAGKAGGLAKAANAAAANADAQKVG